MPRFACCIGTFRSKFAYYMWHAARCARALRHRCTRCATSHIRMWLVKLCMLTWCAIARLPLRASTRRCSVSLMSRRAPRPRCELVFFLIFFRCPCHPPGPIGDTRRTCGAQTYAHTPFAHTSREQARYESCIIYNRSSQWRTSQSGRMSACVCARTATPAMR